MTIHAGEWRIAESLYQVDVMALENNLYMQHSASNKGVRVLRNGIQFQQVGQMGASCLPSVPTSLASFRPRKASNSYGEKLEVVLVFD